MFVFIALEFSVHVFIVSLPTFHVTISFILKIEIV